MNLKPQLEAQKCEKNVVKKLDVELNNSLSSLKRLFTIQSEWSRLEEILVTEQKWLDEFGVSILDLTKTTSKNYSQTISNTQVKKLRI